MIKFLSMACTDRSDLQFKGSELLRRLIGNMPWTDPQLCIF